MRDFLIRWFVTTLAVLVTAHLLSGISYTNLTAVFVASLVLGIINAFVRPLILIITLPLNIIRLGLFTFVLIGKNGRTRMVSVPMGGKELFKDGEVNSVRSNIDIIHQGDVSFRFPRGGEIPQRPSGRDFSPLRQGRR